jgi:hypothetical protein
VELALASYPGFFATSPPGEESAYGVFWPTLIPASLVQEVVVLDDGTRIPIEGPALGGGRTIEPETGEKHTRPPGDQLRRVPFGRAFGARSGDKAGSANVGVWGRSQDAYAWLEDFLTIEEFQHLLPETAFHPVERFSFPNLGPRRAPPVASGRAAREPARPSGTLTSPTMHG